VVRSIHAKSSGVLIWVLKTKDPKRDYAAVVRQALSDVDVDPSSTPGSSASKAKTRRSGARPCSEDRCRPVTIWAHGGSQARPPTREASTYFCGLARGPWMQPPLCVSQDTQ
jgi:hypothetical protein